MSLLTMEPINPYMAKAGTDLDRHIHLQVLREPENKPCPAYSTDDKVAERLKKTFETAYGTTVSTGRTGIPGKTWYARYEVNPGNPTEALAESYALAVCRLVLLWVHRQ